MTHSRQDTCLVTKTIGPPVLGDEIIQPIVQGGLETFQYEFSQEYTVLSEQISKSNVRNYELDSLTESLRKNALVKDRQYVPNLDHACLVEIYALLTKYLKEEKLLESEMKRFVHRWKNHPNKDKLAYDAHYNALRKHKSSSTIKDRIETLQRKITTKYNGRLKLVSIKKVIEEDKYTFDDDKRYRFLQWLSKIPGLGFLNTSITVRVDNENIEKRLPRTLYEFHKKILHMQDNHTLTTPEGVTQEGVVERNIKRNLRIYITDKTSVNFFGKRKTLPANIATYNRLLKL